MTWEQYYQMTKKMAEIGLNVESLLNRTKAWSERSQEEIERLPAQVAIENLEEMSRMTTDIGAQIQRIMRKVRSSN